MISEIHGPSAAMLCKWARVDDSTRTRWVERGLVLRLGGGGATLEAAIEMLVVAQLVELIGLEHAHLAWLEVRDRVTTSTDPPGRLDLVWLAPPGVRLVSTDEEFVQVALEAPRQLIVIPLEPSIQQAQEAYRLFMRMAFAKGSAGSAARERRQAVGPGRRKTLTREERPSP